MGCVLAFGEKPQKPFSIDSTLKSMSLEEKIGQMIMVYHSPYSFLKKHHIGSVLIMSNMLKDPELLSSEIRMIQQKLPIKILVAMDQEGGQVNRLGKIPEWQGVPAVDKLKNWAPDSIIHFNSQVAAALLKLGVNMNLAPVLDPTHDFTGQPAFMSFSGRSFGKSSAEIVPPARAFIEGFSRNGVLCVSKHFPGYDVTSNSDHHIAESLADSASVLKNTLPFQKTMDLVGGVMMSSIHYKKFSQEPSVFSKKIVGWARNMNPDKLIITDDLWGAALRAYVSQKDSVPSRGYPNADFSKLTQMAFLAGNDILMITYPQKVVIMVEAIRKLTDQDPALINQIDSSVRRILTTKRQWGFF